MRLDVDIAEIIGAVVSAVGELPIQPIGPVVLTTTSSKSLYTVNPPALEKTPLLGNTD